MPQGAKLQPNCNPSHPLGSQGMTERPNCPECGAALNEPLVKGKKELELALSG